MRQQESWVGNMWKHTHGKQMEELWFRKRGLSQQNTIKRMAQTMAIFLFLRVLEVRSPRGRAWLIWFLVMAVSLVCRRCLFMVPSHGPSSMCALQIFLLRRAGILWNWKTCFWPHWTLSTSLEAPVQIQPHWRTAASTRNKHSVHNKLLLIKQSGQGTPLV